MKPLVVIVLGAALASAIACSANAPIGDETPTAGTGGPTGVAGVGGPAGTIGTGAAGTWGAAGTTGAAGTGFMTGIAGTSGNTGPGSAGSGGTFCGWFGVPTLASGKCAQGAFKRDGVCQCQAIVPNVCGDKCVDVLTDDDNCGCCGNACGPTSTCNQGKCGPPAVSIVNLAAGCGSLDLTVDGGVLAWTDRDHGVVTSMSTNGGVLTTIAAGEKTPTAAARVGNAIYWQTPGNIRRSIANGPPQTLLANSFDIRGFVVSPDGTSLYFSSGTMVFHVPTTGTPVVTIVAREEHGGLPTALALDGNRLMYPTDLNGDVDVATLIPGKVSSCGLETPNGEPAFIDCMRVARSQGSLFREKIIARPGAVLWIDGSSIKLSSTAPGSTIFNDQIASTILESITGFAATATTVYFSEGSATPDATGVISRSLVQRDQVAWRLARGQRQPRSVVVDDKRVYWSTSDCAIMTTGL